MDRYLEISLVLFRCAVYIQGAEVYESVSAVLGQDVVLPCLGSQHLQVDMLQWTRDDTVVLMYREGSVKDGYEYLSSTDRVQLVDPLHRGGDFSLQLMNVTSKDTGKYKCFIVYEDAGLVSVDSRVIRLNVTEQSQEAEVYESVSAVLGQDVVLPCLGSKHLQVDNLEWTCDGKVVLFYREGSVKDGYEHASYTDRVQLMDPQLGGGDFSLRLMNVTSKDTGKYECFFVYEEAGQVSADSRYIRLTVTEQSQDTTLISTETLRKCRGLVLGLMLAPIIVVFSAFALWKSTRVKMYRKQLHFPFCVERERSRKHRSPSSSTGTWLSENSSRAGVHIHRDSPSKVDPHPRLTFSLTGSTSDLDSTLDLQMKDDCMYSLSEIDSAIDLSERFN